MPRKKIDELRIFRDPHPKRNYVLGGDVAEGLEHGDDSALEVIEIETGQQMAEYYGPNTPPDELGEIAYMLGRAYNWAYIGIENNKDLTPLNKLNYKNMNYPNLHYQQTGEGKQAPTPTDKLGWNTNVLTRYVMVADAASFLRDHAVTIYSPFLIDQIEIFAQNARGKYEAISGGHDDLVMAYLIAIQLMKIRLQRNVEQEQALPATWNGQPIMAGAIDTTPEGKEVTREERIANAVHQAHREEFATTMENLI